MKKTTVFITLIIFSMTFFFAASAYAKNNTVTEQDETNNDTTTEKTEDIKKEEAPVKKGKPKSIKLKWTKKDKPEELAENKWEIYGHEDIIKKRGIRILNGSNYGAVSPEVSGNFKYTAAGVNRRYSIRATIYYGDKKIYNGRLKEGPWQIKVTRKKNKITIEHMAQKTKLKVEDDFKGRIKIDIGYHERRKVIYCSSRESFIEHLELRYKGYKD